jgi:TRAP-type uncharacterized transport system substrate-binding protein
LILVRPDVPDELVYRLARAIHHGQGLLAKQLQQGRYTTLENTIQQVPAARLHPGATRYLREAGLLKK